MKGEANSAAARAADARARYPSEVRVVPRPWKQKLSAEERATARERDRVEGEWGRKIIPAV